MRSKSNYELAAQPPRNTELTTAEPQQPLRVKKTASGRLQPGSSEPQWTTTFLKACGTDSQEFADRLFAQTLLATSRPATLTEQQANANLAMLTGVPASDPMEAALKSHMTAVSEHALGLMAKANAASHGKELYLNTATRLMALFTRQFEALSKHQRKGTQKVVVERVNISAVHHAAIVGEVNRHG